MSWMTALCELYDRNSSLAGKPIADEDGRSTVLLPIFHITQAAQIEVVLSEDGEFISARMLAKKENSTIVPVTEGSSSRTSKPCPHPLCDKLKYVAKDYAYYLDCEDKEKQKYINECFNPYLQQLNEWNNSEYTHPKINAIAKYMNESSGLVGDLIEHGVLVTDDKNILDSKKRIQENSQAEAFVRFVVRSCEISDAPDEVWLDTTLHEKFIQYQLSRFADKELCYVTGKMETPTYLHPSKIMNEGDMTKLISFNDSAGFTYRGRFDNKSETSAVGYCTSQKAHNALKWIIRKQGFTNGNLCFAAWESEDKKIPSILDGMVDIEFDLLSCDDDENDGDTNYLDAQKFNKSLMGYGKKLSYNENMYLMTLEASTPGRLSMTGFTTINTSVYISNIAKWQETCGWMHYTKKNDRVISYNGIPGIRNIAELLYGNESNGYMKLGSGNSVMLNTTIKRLMPCIALGKKIPRDIVNTAIIRASSPVTYVDEKCWAQILALACSLVKKLKYDYKSEVWNMALDTNCTDRSYLYGRLLAVADKIEQLVMSEAEKGRVTNAKRYMNAFSQRPFSTWKIIEEKLEPYTRKLKSKTLLNLLDEIHDKFSSESYANDSKLDGLYLLGYHSQLYALNKSNKKSSDENNSNENNQEEE